MAELKTQPTDESVAAFLDRAAADPARRRDCETLVELMSTATGEPARMWGSSIVGFGRYHYRYASGQEGDWPLVGFSPRKADLTLYLMPGVDVFADQLARLGKHKTGKACLYIKRLADVDIAVLRSMVADAVKRMEPQRVRP